jgi:uncharacterized membrane protein YcaP (DUF421 family)
MWTYSMPWYDPVIRGIVMYAFLFISIKVLGKKQLSKISTFEFGLIFLITFSLFAGVAGNLFSLNFLPAVISISVMLALYALMNELVARYTWFEKIIEGQPVVVILNGKIFKKVMRKQRISESELFEAMREHEIMNPEDVKCAILEKDGNISVIKYDH